MDLFTIKAETGDAKLHKASKRAFGTFAAFNDERPNEPNAERTERRDRS
jgi:hypothetical protein